MINGTAVGLVEVFKLGAASSAGLASAISTDTNRAGNVNECYGIGSFAALSASPCWAAGRFGSSVSASLKAAMARSVLIERGEVSPAIDQHAGVGWQNLEVNHVIFFKPHRPISQTPGLEVRVRRIVKALVFPELENETLRNELIGLSNPLGQVTFMGCRPAGRL